MSESKRSNNSDVESIKDMMNDILAPSSVNSLLTYKTVSKFWRDIICSPEFIKMQVKFSRENMQYIICRCSDYDGTEVVLMDANGEFSIILPFPGFVVGKFVRLVSTFNGLLFLSHGLPNSGLDIIVCNMATKKCSWFTTGITSAVKQTSAVAYNLESGQYKIFTFFKDIFASEEDGYGCAVYEPRTDLLKRIANVKYRPFITPLSTCNDHVCVDGIVYWVGFPNEDPRSGESPVCIVSVDMVDENFKAIDFPEGVTATRASFLINLEGRLSLIVVDCPEFCPACHQCFRCIAHLWVLDDSDQPTWLHKDTFSFLPERIWCIKSVVAHKNEIFFIIVDESNKLHYHIWNTTTHSWTVLQQPQTYRSPQRYAWPVAFPYSESLSPCRDLDPC